MNQTGTDGNSSRTLRAKGEQHGSAGTFSHDRAFRIVSGFRGLDLQRYSSSLCEGFVHTTVSHG